MIRLHVTNSGTLGILTLRGSLSEFHAMELREHLLRSLDSAGRIVVNCEQVTSIDSTCLKLLCTAYRVSRIQNKDFALAGDSALLFRRAGGRAVYPQCDGITQRCAKGCLWTDRVHGNYASAPAQDSAAA